MSLLRRFVADDQRKVQRGADPDASDGGDVSAPEAAAPTETQDALGQSAPKHASREQSRAPHPVLADAVSRTPRPALTVRQSLMVLNSLTPVLRAALIYPGTDARPSDYENAVGRMATTTAALAKGMASCADALEVDGAWASRTLQEVAAQWVSHHWVSTAIAQGGGDAPPDAPTDMFMKAVKRILGQPWPDGEETLALDSVEETAIRLSFLKAFAPVAVEIETYAEVVNRRLEGVVVDAEALQQVLGQALMEQALQARQLLMADEAGSGTDRRMMLQACLAHIGSLYQAAWEPTRGDALGRLVDAPSVKDAQEALAGDGFTHGFLVTAFRSRVTDAAKRLIGTTQAAMEMVAPRTDPKQRQEG